MTNNKTEAALAEENARLRTALDAALIALAPFEQPDSRFVSPLFVSLAAVATHQDDAACWAIIDEWVAAARERDARGEPVEHIPTGEITVTITKNGSFDLPAECVEDRTVHLLIEGLRDTPEEQLRMLSKRQIKGLISGAAHETEVDSAIAILERPDVSILKQVWLYTDALSGEELVVDDELKTSFLETGIFIHPETGNAVSDFRDGLSVYRALNTDNAAFMDWKMEAQAATMRR